MEMTKSYVSKKLKEEHLWKDGQFETFFATLSQRWKITLRKEENYFPYIYVLSGEKIGTSETFVRRYKTMQDAFLHIANNLNENALVKNKYQNIMEWIEE